MQRLKYSLILSCFLLLTSTFLVEAQELRTWKNVSGRVVAESGTLDVDRTRQDVREGAPTKVYLRTDSGSKTLQFVTICDSDRSYVLDKLNLQGEIEPEAPRPNWPASPGQGTRKTLIYNGVEFAFRYCPAGSFAMGSPEKEKGRDEDEVRHNVTLTKGFWIQETETTQEQWDALDVKKKVECNPKGKNYPVERVNWNECNEYIAKLNELKIAPLGLKFSLPTEAQWEYACRAGTQTAYYFGDFLYDDRANYDGSYVESGLPRKNLNSPTLVKSYKPNPWGLYDMYGNVFEWCSDFYGAYPTDDVLDPVGADDGVNRVIRGGSWNYYGRSLRSGARDSSAPTVSYSFVGFRLVLESDGSNANVADDKKTTDDSSINPENGTSQTSETKAGTRKTFSYEGVEFAFRYCPAGSFTMGEIGNDDLFPDYEPHEVFLSKGFWIQETETTQAQWNALGFKTKSNGHIQSDLPISNVNWNECNTFISELNEQNVAPGYTFSLPTEAQWEYACRAGTTSAFPWGDSLNGDKANCDGQMPEGTKVKGKFLGKVCPVKSYPPNSWGVYDMCGNVSEWCFDFYDKYYGGEPGQNAFDPVGPAKAEDRVIRGGSWDSMAMMCRSFYRSSAKSTTQYVEHMGFRLVLSIKTESDIPEFPINPKEGTRRTLKYNGVEFAFRYCPAGTFLMGSPNGEEGNYYSDFFPENQHSVNIEEGFWISETETTQEEWGAVFEDEKDKMKSPKLPVEISEYICPKFIEELNKRHVVKGLRFKLPTEEQWEYACRAGTSGADYGTPLDDCAWYDKNSNGKPHEVGLKKANKWGLFDMLGNVDEWVEGKNWHRENIYMARGGNYDCGSSRCRPADRSRNNSFHEIETAGFRCVLIPEYSE